MSYHILSYVMSSYLAQTSRKHAYIVFTPFNPFFYTVKLGFTGVYINFLISAPKQRFLVLVRTASPIRF